MLNENRKIVSDKSLLFAAKEPKLHYLKISENSDEYLKIWIKEPTWLQVEQGMASVMKINPKTQEMDIDLNNLYHYMIRDAIRGRKTDPEIVSLITVYSLSKALAISPLEVYQMPARLVRDMLMVHGEVEQYKADEMDKEMKKRK